MASRRYVRLCKLIDTVDYPYSIGYIVKNERACYVDFLFYETVYLVTAYAKKDKENLSKAERNNVKKIVEFLKDEVRDISRGDQNE